MPDELNEEHWTEKDSCEQDQEEKAPKFFSVAVVMYDKAYGGPEEGGWYFDTYEPVPEYAHLTKVVKTKAEAYAARDGLLAYIEVEKLNEGRRDVNSVLSEGQYDVYIYHGEYPCYEPKVRPHYE